MIIRIGTEPVDRLNKIFMKSIMHNVRFLLCGALFAGVSIVSAQKATLSIDGITVPLDSNLAEILYEPSVPRLIVNTQWDDLRCMLNPNGPVVSLPDPQPGDFVLELDYRPGDLLGRYVIEADGSIDNLLSAIGGAPIQLEIVTSQSRINNCVGNECATLICVSGGTPIFDGGFEVPPPAQVDFFTSGSGNTSVVAGSASNNGALQLIVSNVSAEPANNVTLDISQTLATGVTANSGSATAGNYNSSTGSWTINSLAPGENETLTLLYTVAANAVSGNSVCASVQVDSADEIITNTGDDFHQQCFTIEREVDLNLLINNPSEPAGPGDIVQYVIELDTNGPSDASNVVVQLSESLTSDVTRSNAFSSVGSFNGSNLTWTIPSVPEQPPTTRTLTLFYSVDSGIDLGNGNQFEISAEITGSSEARINPADDAVSDTTGLTDQ